MATTIKKINYKSDFELIYTLTDNEGNPLSVPDNPWELWLSVGNPLGTNVRKFIAKYDGGDYTNCRVQDDTIVVIADNHKLPTGHLWTTFIDYQPNSDYPDGDKRIYTPQPCNVELVTGAGDAPTETDIEILANYVVFEHEYTAGQGITIENDVISATGESYTAGEGITIADGEIGLSQGTLDELESHDGDIRDLNTSVNSLERGNERAVRLTDTTTTGEAGKVVKVDEIVVGSTYSRITADIFESKMVESDGGVCYAFPSSSNEVKTNADDMLLASGDKVELEQQINGKASTSSVNAIDGRVTNLENTYNDTMNIANNQLHELIDGKAMIASALTDRGYPTQPTDSSASMAQKIENMSYDAGWLAQLGYSETNDGGVKEAVAYSKAIKDSWDATAITRRFGSDKKLAYFPVVDTSQFTSMASMFTGCITLVAVPTLNLESVTNADSMFKGCTALVNCPYLDLKNATTIGYMFQGDTRIARIKGLNCKSNNYWWQVFDSCSSLERIDEMSFYSATGLVVSHKTFYGCTSLSYLLAKDIGRNASSMAGFSYLQYWGNYSEENRMSLVNSLLTYSYDRTTAELSACTITLHADALARLTAEEIAAITAKGFTLTS